jgi:PAS domain S-box-containing protein
MPCAAAVLGLVIIRALPANLSGSVLHGRMLSIHLVLELFAIFIASLIVTVSSHTFAESRDRNAPALIAGFTIIAVCDLMHALTYQGMPEFLTESSTRRAIFFWLMGRTFEVATLGVIAFDRVPNISRSHALALGASTAAAIVAAGSWAIDKFPPTFVEGTGVTPFKANFEYSLCIANLLIAAYLGRRAVREDAGQYTLLALSAFMVGIGELSFTSYSAPSDFQNIFGHIYKLIAYGVLYRATYITGIRAPYESLLRSEASLRDSRLQFRTLGANLPGAILFQHVMAHDGRRWYTQISDSVEPILGVTAEDALRNPRALVALLASEEAMRLDAAVKRSAETLQTLETEVLARRPDGIVRRIHLAGAPRRLADGATVWDGVIIDVTERREAQEHRRMLEAQLQEAQKMDSIGTLASGIAHDFNNVLGAIIGNLALAREDNRRGEHDEVERSLEQAQRASLRARDLVQQILTFGRKSAPERSTQQLGPIIEESVSLLRSTLPANVSLTMTYSHPLARSFVDRTQIVQVVLNLCTNAWHALGERGGRITVGLGAAEISAEYAAAAGVVPGPFAHFWVEDTGCGMDDATVKRVFEPFFTTKPIGRGTGLGLSVVHGIVKSHDGAITVRSMPDRGTRFDIYLPCPSTCEPAAPTRPDAGQEAMVIGHGGRVAYVDDDEVMSILVERLLARSGHVVTCFADPESLFAMFEADANAFDVLVADYNMPTYSGLEVIDRIRRVNLAIPCVLTSGSVTDELRPKAAGAGVHAIIEKQQTLEKLPAIVGAALARKTGSGDQPRGAAGGRMTG